MYVPRMNKKLVLLAFLEDKGYDVVFNEGKACLKHFATRQVKQIGVRVTKIYKFEVDTCVALSSKEDISQSRDVAVERKRERAINMKPIP